MKNTRQSEIVKLLAIKRTLGIEELSEHFGVSVETIRRDVRTLIHLGIARKVYGGIQILSDNAIVSELENWNVRNDLNHEEKQMIASRALELIPDGATIALDIGTTTHALVQLLGTKRNLKIIISSIRMAGELARGGVHEIYMIGGQLHNEEQVTMGTFARDFLDHFALIDLFFCSADGFTLDCGITEFCEAVADVKRQLISISEKTILMIDHSKFGRKAHFKCPTKFISTLITDAQTPEHYIETLKKSGTQVIVV